MSELGHKQPKPNAGFRRVLWVVVVAGALAGLFVYGILRDPTRRDDIPSALIDRPTPNFAMPLFDRYQNDYGEIFEPGTVQGRPMVINFWAWWCVPCEEEAPMLEAAWREYGDAVLFVGVHTLPRGNIKAANDFLTRHDITYPNGKDENNRINIDYGLFGIPETFFIRADGTVNYRFSGPLTREALDTQIKDLLNQS